MNIEDRLKSLILERYGSVREFTMSINMPYSTFDTILKRGIQNATVSNIIKICEALNISADALAKGEIVRVSKVSPSLERSQDVSEILKNTRELLLNYEGLMFNGKPADAESINSILEAMEIGMEIAKRKSNDKKGE
ncbi:MAG: hypothetical protein ACI4DV_08235 [Lachnospiraceae bacterium]